MKRSIFGALSLSAVLLSAGGVYADEVLAVADDNTADKSVGTLTCVMIGSAAGGPLGALAGAGFGWLGHPGGNLPE